MTGETPFDMQSTGSSTALLLPEIKKPSKVRVVLIVLVILLLVLSIAFIGLYVIEKNGDSYKETVGGANSSKTTPSPTTITQNPTENQPCSTSECVVSAAGES